MKKRITITNNVIHLRFISLFYFLANSVGYSRILDYMRIIQCERNVCFVHFTTG